MWTMRGIGIGLPCPLPGRTICRQQGNRSWSIRLNLPFRPLLFPRYGSGSMSICSISRQVIFAILICSGPILRSRM